MKFISSPLFIALLAAGLVSLLATVAVRRKITPREDPSDQDYRFLVVRMKDDGGVGQCWMLKEGYASSFHGQFVWNSVRTADRLVITAPHMCARVKDDDWDDAARLLGLPSVETCWGSSDPVTPEAP